MGFIALLAAILLAVTWAVSSVMVMQRVKTQEITVCELLVSLFIDAFIFAVFLYEVAKHA